mmetsp:Transcript_79949/g.222762  ORF Transcript_79949/g.222762 Transcript_79949/m.222762 type:complete len:315 (-) Transcript_79949:395-1339(-)
MSGFVAATTKPHAAVGPDAMSESPEVSTPLSPEPSCRPLRVAFLGNSYLYFNDVPRVFRFLCGGRQHVEIKDCLRGGASWKSLLQGGNGMKDKFMTPNALEPDGSYDIGAPTVEALLSDSIGWDFVVMNTYSQEAAMLERREDGLQALETLSPMINEAGACPVLMPTPAYRTHCKGSARIGDWQDFTRKQSEGFGLYTEKLAALCPAERQPRVADVNRAFATVRDENVELWRDLFHSDDFHPSALGSFLEACAIFCAVFGEEPALPATVLDDPGLLFADARRMLPPPAVGRMPTAEELLYLRGVAVRTWTSAKQ